MIKTAYQNRYVNFSTKANIVEKNENGCRRTSFMIHFYTTLKELRTLSHKRYRKLKKKKFILFHYFTI